MKTNPRERKAFTLLRATNLLSCSLALVALSFLLVGCHKSATSLGSTNAKLFASAPEPVKAGWDQANAAIGTNGYAVAIVSLRNLQRENLTPEQLKAVSSTLTAVSDQMYDAANKGDAAAKQALDDLRKMMAR